MEFALDLKDLVYLAINVATVVTLLAAFRNRILNLEKLVKKVESVLFKADSTLNVVTRDVCTDTKQGVEKLISREAKITQKAFESIDVCNANIVKILLHMGLEPEQRGKKH